jgi:release factor glutamine methyltransferase
MQNFKDGNVPVGDNKASSLMKLAERELSALYPSSELETISFWLLEHFTGIVRNNFLKDPGVNLNQSSIIHFCNAVEKLKNGSPVQYVIGEVDFYGLKLEVNNSVLIPRPETEELVDLITKENQGKTNLRILDIGTGSGCIALSLAKNLKDSVVKAIDISESALEVAKSNAVLNRITNIEFLRIDVLKENCFADLEFDMIVSNPPYIAASESATMEAKVLEFEPKEALFVPDENALIFYREIASMSNKHLNKKGLVYIEINERLGDETAAVFSEEVFSSVNIIKDMFGKNRFIKAVKV